MKCVDHLGAFMRVLWIINVVPQEETSNCNSSSVVFDGGWIFSMAKELAKIDNIVLGIAYLDEVKELEVLYRQGVCLFRIPGGMKTKTREPDRAYSENCEEIIRVFRPDVIHIHGTEYPHVLYFVRNYANISVISIQGLLYKVSYYFNYGLSIPKAILSFKPTEIVDALAILVQKGRFSRRIEPELEILHNCKNVIGRTTWDYANVTYLNRNIHYYHCNETLRDDFYSYSWCIDEMERHSIFVGNASIPYKGFHMLLDAARLLLSDYPDLKIYSAGYSIMPRGRWDWKKRLGYARYIRRMLQGYSLQNAVVFTGVLSAYDMAKYLSRCNVFVLPSSIENSPNTLGEAMLVGAPIVAADVGGVTSLVSDGKEALVYRFEEVEMLASLIARIFEDDDLANDLSRNAQKRAMITHDKSRNVNVLLRIYQEVLESSKKDEGGVKG